MENRDEIAELVSLLSKVSRKETRAALTLLKDYLEMKYEVAYLINTVKRIEKYLYYQQPNESKEKKVYQPELFEPEDYDQAQDDSKGEKEKPVSDIFKLLNEASKDVAEMIANLKEKGSNNNKDSLDEYAKKLCKELLSALQ